MNADLTMAISRCMSIYQTNTNTLAKIAAHFVVYRLDGGVLWGVIFLSQSLRNVLHLGVTLHIRQSVGESVSFTFSPLTMGSVIYTYTQDTIFLFIHSGSEESYTFDNFPLLSIASLVDDILESSLYQHSLVVQAIAISLMPSWCNTH